MMRDSINVVVVQAQGILLERETQKKKLKCEKTQGKVIDGPFHLHLTQDMVR